MRDIIFNLKNIVVVILASEFMKQLIVSKKYKSYINFAISISVTGFIIATISNAGFSISVQPDFNYAEPENNENLIIREYENKIIERISKEIPEINEIEMEIDKQYNITNLKIKAPNFSEEADKKLKELGFKSYEIVD